MIPSTITLTVTHGLLQGKEYLFDSPAQCVIGRAGDCEIQLPGDCYHMDVSRHHCLLEIAPPAIAIRDLGSRNGTFVNGVRLERPLDPAREDQPPSPVAAADLKDGDQLQVGHTRFQVKVENAGGVLIPILFC
jgi:pSer/pThr/pTyr-binding forkhead associated (FHA) protein